MNVCAIYKLILTACLQHMVVLTQFD